MGALEKSAGGFLILVSVLMLIYSMPSITTAFNTGVNSTYENLTADQKQIVHLNSYIIFFLPFFLIVVGTAIILKG